MNTRKTRKAHPARPAPIGYLILTKDGQPAAAAITGVRGVSSDFIKLFPSYESARRIARRSERAILAMRGSIFGNWEKLSALTAALPLRVQPVHGKHSA
ncbi:hypothetical protein [Geminisphaera colitermitum]|uniref:hypothetical protein n=1 Tax=Geminisphaera colitermitum TaxID=1148786 RepID=UPI000158C716|nr:hypothetical protein [Geminisphaera colitermitum]